MFSFQDKMDDQKQDKDSEKNKANLIYRPTSYPACLMTDTKRISLISNFVFPLFIDRSIQKRERKTGWARAKNNLCLQHMASALPVTSMHGGQNEWLAGRLFFTAEKIPCDRRTKKRPRHV